MAPDPALTALRRLSEAGLAARIAGDVTAVLVDELRRLLAPDEVQIFEVSQDLEVAQAIAGVPADEPRDFRVQVFHEGPSGVARVVATGASLHVPDAKGSRHVRQDLVAHQKVASLLYVPVSWDGTVRFVAVLLSRTPRVFSNGEIATAETLSGHAAVALALHESISGRAAQAERDHALARAARALNASLVLEEVLETLTREADLAVGGSMAGVYLADGSGGGRATAGHNMVADWMGLVILPGEGVGGQVLATGRPVIANAYQTQVVLPRHSSLRSLQTAVSVPMTWNGELKGALSVGFSELRRVTDDDLRTLEAIAELAVVACRNAEAYGRARVAANTDALTGLLNHGALQVRTREEVARARRERTPLSCLILDLDDFKGVNDARGHMAGDELLRLVATALRGELREYDLIARYGGDEFVVLLPGAVEATARLVADRVRSALLRPAAGEAAGECSVGVAEWCEPLTATELLDRSDRALRLAKGSGKGRVAVAGAGIEQQLELLQAADGSAVSGARPDDGSPAAVQALAGAIEVRDNYTHQHSEQVLRLAVAVARALGLGPAEIEHVGHAALLHDVGKLAIPDEILHKPGPLTDAEWKVMAGHPALGERILQRTAQLEHLAVTVRHEHERWDGAGYPDGLAGQSIPVASRIILACDAYNAMITTRPYRVAMSPGEAVAELRAKSGSQFDPAVVSALLDLLERPGDPVSAAVLAS